MLHCSSERRATTRGCARNWAFVRQKIQSPVAKIIRTSTKLSDCGPSINRSFASVSYKSDLAPYQGTSSGWRFRGLKTWAKPCSPSRVINHPKSSLTSHHSAQAPLRAKWKNTFSPLTELDFWSAETFLLFLRRIDDTKTMVRVPAICTSTRTSS